MKDLKLLASLLIIVFSYTMENFAQQASHIREERPLGAYVTLGGPSFIASGVVDYFISPAVQVEAGAGLIGYFGGIKFHYSRPKNQAASLYTGADISHLRMKGVGTVSGIYAR